MPHADSELGRPLDHQLADAEQAWSAFADLGCNALHLEPAVIMVGRSHDPPGFWALGHR